MVPELKAFFPWSFFTSSSLLHNLSLIWNSMALFPGASSIFKSPSQSISDLKLDGPEILASSSSSSPSQIHFVRTLETLRGLGTRASETVAKVIQGSSSASSFLFTIHFWFKTWWPGACFLHLLFLPHKSSCCKNPWNLVSPLKELQRNSRLEPCRDSPRAAGPSWTSNSALVGGDDLTRPLRDRHQGNMKACHAAVGATTTTTTWWWKTRLVVADTSFLPSFRRGWCSKWAHHDGDTDEDIRLPRTLVSSRSSSCCCCFLPRLSKEMSCCDPRREREGLEA